MKTAMERYRNGYATLLRLYPRAYYNRFAEGMEQTFVDVLRECAAEGRGLHGCALRMCANTIEGIVGERIRTAMVNKTARRLMIWAAVVGLILLAPLLANAPWSASDFVAAGGLLFGTGLAYELLTRRAGAAAYRAAVGVALSAALLLVWINLAVGIIGSEDNPANLLYFGVLAVGLTGAGIARFEAIGMARALFATAAAQALAPVMALVFWKPAFTSGTVAVLGVNALFVLLFAASGLLFRHASATRPA